MRELNQPAGERSRGNALAGSPHTRLIDQIHHPTQDHDPDRAAEICASVCRQAMPDFAPALVLIPAEERRRIQALAAYAITLFDFARQPGLEGERLAGLNRWEFQLEEALDGNPTGQPVFVRLALAEGERPWLRDEFDRLHQLARHLAVTQSTDHGSAATRHLAEIADAWLALVLGTKADTATVTQAAAFLRLRSLLGTLRAGGSAAENAQSLLATESGNLRDTLAESLPKRSPARGYRAATSYLRFASLHLLGEANATGKDTNEPQSSLGILRRLIILVRARWFQR